MMLSTRQQTLLTCLSYIVFLSPVSAQGHGGYGGPAGSPGGNSNSGNNGGWPGSNTGGQNADSSYSSSDVAKYSRIITIHAVLACLVWVFLIPVGGILIRSGIKTPHLLKIHGFLQSISYIIYVLAVAMGIYLVQSFSSSYYTMWSDPHTRIGIGILVLAFFMPALGWVHHKIYVRRAEQFKEGGPRPGRTAPGYIHLWLGRLLIVAGIVNGGLGIKLASSSPYSKSPRTKIIAYIIGSSIMFLLYLTFVVMGEMRRSKERRDQVPNRRAVPMVAQEYQPVRAVPDHEVAVPPTYEQSELFLPTAAKTVNSTARYE